MQLGDLQRENSWMCKVNLSGRGIPFDPNLAAGICSFRWQGQLWQFIYKYVFFNICLLKGILTWPTLRASPKKKAFHSCDQAILTPGKNIVGLSGGFPRHGSDHGTCTACTQRKRQLLCLLALLGFRCDPKKPLMQPTQVIPLLDKSVDSPSI